MTTSKLGSTMIHGKADEQEFRDHLLQVAQIAMVRDYSGMTQNEGVQVIRLNHQYQVYIMEEGHMYLINFYLVPSEAFEVSL
jgi:hypothetical protein